MANVSLKISSDFEQAQKDFERLSDLSEATKTKIKNFSESFKADQIDKFSERNRLAAIAVEATSGKFASMQAESKGLKREIERLIKNGLSPNDDQLKKLVTSYQSLEGELGKVDTEVKKVDVSFGSMVKGIIGADAIRGAFNLIKDGFVSIVDNAKKLEDTQAAFTPLLGNTEKAKDLVNQLNIAAAQTPFQFEDISKATTTLLPTMNGDIEKTVETFKMLGDTAGGNAQKLDTITRGFSKAMLKGKVDMESLNMIAEAGVPIFNEMADTMGYGQDNMQAFFKEVSSGKVSTDVLTETFKKMTSEGGIFFEGMIIASQTTSGVLSTLSDNVAMVAAGIGQEFLPYIKEGALWVTKIAGGILEWISSGENLENTLSIIGYAVATLTGAYIAYQVAALAGMVSTISFSGAIESLTAAVASNPIGLIAAAITAVLIPGIIYLIKNWDKVKFSIQDFSDFAQIKFLEFDTYIREKVIGGVVDLLSVLNQIPGMSGLFDSVIESQNQAIETNKNNIAELTNLRTEHKKAFEAMNTDIGNNIAVNDNAKDIIKANNEEIKASYQDRTDFIKKAMNDLVMTENQLYNDRVNEAQNFFKKRGELETQDGQARIDYLKTQYAEIAKMAQLSAQEQIDISIGLMNSIEDEQRKLNTARVSFVNGVLNSSSNLVDNLSKIAKNSGKDWRDLAYVQKGIAMAQAAINTALAISQSLALIPPPGNFIAASIAGAAGLAEEIAIATTPIPTAQTGGTFTVPDLPQYRNDNFPIPVGMAGPGEEISVTPRGENAGGPTTINIEINKYNLFRIVTEGIRNGDIPITDRNIGQARFI